ncbi:protein ACTIVITY OF BC1 COMPLEX KINASE 7, chloroplastic isoform X2 [Pistacia vera]|uniref:protein ACTIVITY OF BC1 COMPLEX KINASE 7, chloroplastic isoform X2 n=1 Tax=Pistacia vera TaxID=55513 RepID=UPI001262FF42|nr:protein ACTIVITY OF BC1 COMPLEX KINASE 7, chloroplastic isoform X2 [Pistacia vera]
MKVSVGLMRITTLGKGQLMFGRLLLHFVSAFCLTTPNGHILEATQKISRKTEDKELPLGYGNVYCNLVQLLLNLGSYLLQGLIFSHASLLMSLPSYRIGSLPSHLRKQDTSLRMNWVLPSNSCIKSLRTNRLLQLVLVHRAILHNGEKVVVKVQRPGLKKLFDIDLRNLKLIAEYFQRSETFGGPTRDWLGIYEECATILYQEIDYINEGKNADRFRRDFRNVKWVRVPLVFWDYTATKVLTLEYVPGIKINELDALDLRGFTRSQIASRAIEAYLIQILKTGFFHADPHPGNLAVDVDEALIYYDFGMMGEIKSFTRERLLELFYAVYEKDAKKVIRSLIDLEALQPTGDLSSVRRSVQFFLDNLLSQSPDQQQTLAAIGEDLFAVAQDQPFRFPSTFTFVIRAFSTLEGIGYILDPDFSFVKVAAPYAQDLLDIRQQRRSGTQLVEEIRKQADDARSSTISMPSRVQRIEEFVKQLEVGDLKLRVRVLESERAARKSSILQMATIYTVFGGTLLNLGVTLSGQGSQLFANGSFIGAGVFFTLFLRSMQRVKKLDKFEKMI